MFGLGSLGFGDFIYLRGWIGEGEMGERRGMVEGLSDIDRYWAEMGGGGFMEDFDYMIREERGDETG